MSWASTCWCPARRRRSRCHRGWRLSPPPSARGSAPAIADHPRYYFDLRRERTKQAAGQTAFTPAISLVVGLDEILTMMREEGLEQIHERHDRTARAVRAGLEAMGLELFAEVPSNSVSSARLPEGVDSPAVCKRIRDHYGVTIAGGQDQLKPFLIRIGHLGFISRHSVALGLAALESSLLDCGHTLDRGAGCGRRATDSG